MTKKFVQLFVCNFCHKFFSVTKGHEFIGLPKQELEVKKEEIRTLGLTPMIMARASRRCSVCQAGLKKLTPTPINDEFMEVTDIFDQETEEREREDEENRWDDIVRVYEDR